MSEEDKKAKSKDKNPKSHFWISDNEVDSVEAKPMAIPEPVDVEHDKHGALLNAGIVGIKKFHAKQKTPISDEVVIFKVELADTEVVDARGGHQLLFENNHLKINSIKKSNVAIVSATPAILEDLQRKLNSYTRTNGKSQGFFQYFKSFSNYDGSEKINIDIANEDPSEEVETYDVQITLVPNLALSFYEKMLGYLSEEIHEKKGELIDTIFLQNNTPIIRAILPSSGLEQLSDQEIILGIDNTVFFKAKTRGGGRTQIDLDDAIVNFSVPPTEMPIVCVLDDGIQLPQNLVDCIAGRFVCSNLSSTPSYNHGTKVASRLIFGDDIDTQVRDKVLVPKVRVIDAIINDGVSAIDETTLIKRIREAVDAIKDVTKIFCLSMNSLAPLSGDNVSNLGFELDSLSRRYKIQFLVPTGNHTLWTSYSSISDVIDDDGTRLASPGDSFCSLTIGSIVRDDHSKSLSQKYDPSPFSRVGFGFAGSAKPDLVYPGGNVFTENGRIFICANSAAYVITKDGSLSYDYGTSFSTPIAAQELALLTDSLPNKDLETAKALLLHHAEAPNFDLFDQSQESRELFSKIYGKGNGSLLNAKDSYKGRATYIRKGVMSRLTKQRVKFYMPTTMAAHSNKKKPAVKVSVTCISFPPVDQSMGYEYLRAYVDTSLHKINSNNKMMTDNPAGKEGRYQWQNIQHFSRILNSFNHGDWQLWLQLYTKPELDNTEEVDYVLIVTIEDLTANDVDVHGGIEVETLGRFNLLSEVEVDSGDIEE